MIKVRVYGKSDCSLCTKALGILKHLQDEFGLAVEYVDITGDGALYDRYRARIPVVCREGREIASGIVTTPGLRQVLRGTGAARG